MERADQIQMEVVETIPSRLETPPSSKVSPPVQTKLQELPFSELSWEDFEKLCLRLVKLDATVEYCTLYGRRGQKQYGIDIYARKSLDDKYKVYQCKNVKEFGKGDIEDAVTEFLKGKWANKSEIFVLCTPLNLRDIKLQDTIEQENRILKEKGIIFISWDRSELNLKLKNHPEIVDDFFGREWTRAFCGEDEATRLGSRLDAKGVTDFRKEMSRFYKNVFNTQDPGLFALSGSCVSILPLENRYILPDIYEGREIKIVYSPDYVEESKFYNEAFAIKAQSSPPVKSEDELKSPGAYQTKSIQKNRISVDTWLLRNYRSVVLGDPGSGKSSLLRFLAMDLLSKEPQLCELVHTYGHYLPVWIPFGLWATMIQKNNNKANSLQDVLRSWLEKWNENRLWPLVEQALGDDRLLLLVDGLDEWINLSAGQIALDRLQVFIKQRNVPAIVTSRPLGFNRLGMQTAGWQVAELADFSNSQQEELTRIWFGYWIKNISGFADSGKDQLNNKITSICKEFWVELTRTMDLTELAKIPLLLSLLIYLWLQKSKLPRNRFKAYSELIDHLIAEHPMRRRRDTGQTEDVFCGFSPDDIRNILAYIAYVILSENPEGVVEVTKVKKIVCKHLQDREIGYGYNLSEANRISKQLVNIAENSLGLMVRKSPNEVGFFHRSFLEYLAAYHISRLSLEDQLQLVQDHFPDEQWREVILALFQITKRASDIDKFAETIQKNISNPLDSHSAEQILSEAIFGDFNCSIDLIKSLAKEYFERIELGSWLSHREILLRNVLNGLHNSKTRDLVKTKLANWFPEIIPRWQDVFEYMETWPKCPEVIECLFKGLYNEHVYNKLSCAFSLATIAKGDSSVGDKLARIAQVDHDPNIRAAALQGLVVGWPKQKGLDQIIETSHKSLYPALKFAAIFCNIELGKYIKSDRKYLLYPSSNIEYGLKYDIPSLVIKGWPNSPDVKAECLSSIRFQGYRGRDEVPKQISFSILLKGYPQDNQVADYCASQIRNEKHPFLMGIHIDAWELLARNFKDHPKLIEAIDDWIVNADNAVLPRETSFAALVGRTQICKKTLLSQLDSSFSFWAAQGLLAGWGMEDSEVGTPLKEIAYGPNKEASRIAHLLPQIIKNQDQCRKRLVELLEDKDCSRQDFVVQGLIELDDFEKNPFVVDKLFEALSRLDKDKIGYKGIVDGLIVSYPKDPRVRELAKDALRKRWGAHKAIVKAYGNDEEIRKMFIGITNPLPTPLRLLIAKKLGDELETQDFALSLLRLYDLESDPIVKTESSISYHKLLKLSGKDLTAASEQLSANIMCYGPDYEERRHAAFCGLLVLDRLDIMQNKRETIGDRNEICSIRITHYQKNTSLLKQILQNWNKIKSVFGTELWDRLNKYDGESIYAWENICMLADAYPDVKQDAINFVNSTVETGTLLSPTILRFVSRVCPRSELLSKCCLSILLHKQNNKERVGYDQMYLAAKLLGEHFESNQEILGKLAEHIRANFVPVPILIAFAYGWQQSPEFERSLEIISDQRVGLDFGVHVKLCCLRKEKQDVLKMISKLLKDCEEDMTLVNILDSRYIGDSIISRLREDEDLRNILKEKIMKNPSPSEKASFPRLLSAAQGLCQELRKWCIEELSRQQGNYPEVGIDLLASKLMPVSHSLLSILEH